MFKKSIATIAINLPPRKGSWGGANQWTSQLTGFLRYTGYDVRHDLKKPVDAIVLTHTGLSAGTSFGADEVEVYRAKSARKIPCIHRINDNDIRKGTTEMDAFLSRSSRVADHTVFVSDWLRDHHAAKWFDNSRPHSVIEPGADPAVFHPLGNRPWNGTEPFRIVTHHWSDNWSKGFDIYRDIDDAIASGDLSGCELWIIGRWPSDLKWKNARTIGPASGPELAALLRQCHAYVTASRYEPGAMHPVEGLQCGLPLLYHPETGGSLTVGKRYGTLIEGSVSDAVRAHQRNYASLRAKLLSEPPSGDLMCLSYRRLIQRLISEI